MMRMGDRRLGETTAFRESTGASLRWLVMAALCGGVLAGCVTSEKYEAEKARALNFQRLLAQEEKRSSELQEELQRAKREVSELEMRNRSLSSELDSMQSQISRLQAETAQLREQATRPVVEEGIEESEDLSLTLSEPMMSDLESELEGGSLGERGSLGMDEPDMGGASLGEPAMKGAASGDPIYYTVKRGDTLFSLSRTYDVTVKQIKRWNDLDSNLIRVGERLVVGYR